MQESLDQMVVEEDKDKGHASQLSRRPVLTQRHRASRALSSLLLSLTALTIESGADASTQSKSCPDSRI